LRFLLFGSLRLHLWLWTRETSGYRRVEPDTITTEGMVHWLSAGTVNGRRKEWLRWRRGRDQDRLSYWRRSRSFFNDLAWCRMRWKLGRRNW
jgi:hypothetical protein